jgi:hypothetical protein
MYAITVNDLSLQSFKTAVPIITSVTNYEGLAAVEDWKEPMAAGVERTAANVN